MHGKNIIQNNMINSLSYGLEGPVLYQDLDDEKKQYIINRSVDLTEENLAYIYLIEVKTLKIVSVHYVVSYTNGEPFFFKKKKRD